MSPMKTQRMLGDCSDEVKGHRHNQPMTDKDLDCILEEKKPEIRDTLKAWGHFNVDCMLDGLAESVSNLCVMTVLHFCRRKSFYKKDVW